MGLKELVFGKKEKLKKVTLIMLEAHQCRCIGEEGCKAQIIMYDRTWCGIAPKIDYNCKHRRPPEVVP
jgi:hypothetical protein